MYYETDKNDHGLRYNPFSFFNLLGYDPPFVMFSAAVHEVDGGKKDTVVFRGTGRRSTS